MKYVYLLESLGAANARYVGMTSDLKRRLAEHNAGKSPHGEPVLLSAAAETGLPFEALCEKEGYDVFSPRLYILS